MKFLFSTCLASWSQHRPGALSLLRGLLSIPRDLPVPLRLFQELLPKWQLIFRRAIISYNIPLLRQHRPDIKRSNPLPTFLLLRGVYSSIHKQTPSLSCRPGTHFGAGYHGDKASFLSFSSWSFQSSRERITCPVLFHLESTLEAPGYFWKASKSRLQSNEIRISGCGSPALWWFYNVEPRLRSI